MCIVNIVGGQWPAERAFPLRDDAKRRDGISDYKKEFSRAVLLLLLFWFLFVRLF